MSETVEAYLVNLHSWALYTLYGDKMLFLSPAHGPPSVTIMNLRMKCAFCCFEKFAGCNKWTPARDFKFFSRNYYVGTSVDYVNISLKKSVQLYFERKNKFKGGVFRRVFRNDPSTISWSYNLFSVNFGTYKIHYLSSECTFLPLISASLCT